MPEEDQRTPVEKAIANRLEDENLGGRPMSWRARKTRRTVESYLRAGVVPRYMQRLREIERGTEDHLRRLERAHRVLGEQCGLDRELFAQRWLERVERWDFEPINELIRQHNEWYPVEAQLPLDPRTRDYVKIRGRSYRRDELGPDWALERFPLEPPASGASSSQA